MLGAFIRSNKQTKFTSIFKTLFLSFFLSGNVALHRRLNFSFDFFFILFRTLEMFSCLVFFFDVLSYREIVKYIRLI